MHVKVSILKTRVISIVFHIFLRILHYQHPFFLFLINQAISQRYVGAEQAALVYALDPVWGAFFANYLLGKSSRKND